MDPTGPSLPPPILELRVGGTGASAPGWKVGTWLGGIGSHRWCVSCSSVGASRSHHVGGWRTWALGPGSGLGLRWHVHARKHPLSCPLCLSRTTLVTRVGRAGWLVGGRRNGEQGVRMSFKGNPVSPSLCLRWGPELSGGLGVQDPSLEREGRAALCDGVPGLCTAHDGILVFLTTSP